MNTSKILLSTHLKKSKKNKKNIFCCKSEPELRVIERTFIWRTWRLLGGKMTFYVTWKGGDGVEVIFVLGGKEKFDVYFYLRSTFSRSKLRTFSFFKNFLIKVCWRCFKLLFVNVLRESLRDEDAAVKSVDKSILFTPKKSSIPR